MMMVMTLSTAFTKLFGVRHPITLAPMGVRPVVSWWRQTS
jgi:NAD(P)H-dependent flavin oxidoreductase YrpB (nitropropane dioxygenase family)